MYVVPVNENNWLLNITGGSSVLSSRSSYFTFPHFTLTIKKRFF